MGLRDASQRPALTEAHLAQLSKGVRLVFARWTALQLAIANQWGGPDSDEKARTLVDKVVTWLQETKEVYADELEDLLDVELLDEWNTQTEDGSVGQVAQCVAKIFYETLRGAGDQVEALERLSIKLVDRRAVGLHTQRELAALERIARYAGPGAPR